MRAFAVFRHPDCFEQTGIAVALDEGTRISGKHFHMSCPTCNSLCMRETKAMDYCQALRASEPYEVLIFCARVFTLNVWISLLSMFTLELNVWVD